jgi:diadenosine tetraphosphate (Ap4A) HIT family hydrolase
VTVLPTRRVPWDMPGYLRRVRAACFVCELLAGNPEYAHHVVHRDDIGVVFLAKYPVVWGHLLVAPIAHREHVFADFTADEHAALQRRVHRAGRALTRVVPTERAYVLSLGSQQGNRHVHWHVVPLPPGVPYEEQQIEVFAESKGYLDADDAEMAELASRVGDAFEHEEG